jgi:hypothetical protein
MLVGLEAMLNEYVRSIHNNHFGEGLALQITYTGVVELGQWIMLNPGKRTSVSMRLVDKTVRDEGRMIWNPLALMDSKVNNFQQISHLIIQQY